MSVTTAVRVLDTHVDDSQARTLVRRHTLRGRVRDVFGGRPKVEVLGELYWPIAVVHATARSSGRRQWVERVQGAIDLVSGRIGLVDVELPADREVEVGQERLIAARLGRAEALAAWHEYFRDYVDRRRKPMRPPGLSVDRVERLWVPHRVAVRGDARFLVDPVTSRAERMENFPSVAKMLAAAEGTVGLSR